MQIAKIVLLTFVLGLGLATPAFAQETTVKPTEKPARKEQLKDKLMKLADSARAAVGSCKLESRTGTTVLCSKDGKTYTIDASKAVIVRKFGGKSSLDELTMGDVINVVGRWTDEAKTTIQAKLIRDTSIQKRKGAFVGKVKELTAEGFVMTTVSAKRPDQTVVVGTETKYVNRKEESLTRADIKVEDRVRVKGLWNNDTNTVTEVTQVKDYSLPAKKP